MSKKLAMKIAAEAHSYASENAKEFTPEFMGYYDRKFARLVATECIAIMLRDDAESVADAIWGIATAFDLDMDKVLKYAKV